MAWPGCGFLKEREVRHLLAHPLQHRLVVLRLHVALPKLQEENQHPSMRPAKTKSFLRREVRDDDTNERLLSGHGLFSRL